MCVTYGHKKTDNQRYMVISFKILNSGRSLNVYFTAGDILLIYCFQHLRAAPD